MNENDLVVRGSIYFLIEKKNSQQSTYRSQEWKEVSPRKEIGLFFCFYHDRVYQSKTTRSIYLNLDALT